MYLLPHCQNGFCSLNYFFICNINVLLNHHMHIPVCILYVLFFFADMMTADNLTVNVDRDNKCISIYLSIKKECSYF